MVVVVIGGDVYVVRETQTILVAPPCTTSDDGIPTVREKQVIGNRNSPTNNNQIKRYFSCWIIV